MTVTVAKDSKVPKDTEYCLKQAYNWLCMIIVGCMAIYVMIYIFQLINPPYTNKCISDNVGALARVLFEFLCGAIGVGVNFIFILIAGDNIGETVWFAKSQTSFMNNHWRNSYYFALLVVNIQLLPVLGIYIAGKCIENYLKHLFWMILPIIIMDVAMAPIILDKINHLKDMITREYDVYVDAKEKLKARTSD